MEDQTKKDEKEKTFDFHPKNPETRYGSGEPKLKL